MSYRVLLHGVWVQCDTAEEALLLTTRYASETPPTGEHYYAKLIKGSSTWGVYRTTEGSDLDLFVEATSDEASAQRRVESLNLNAGQTPKS